MATVASLLSGELIKVTRLRPVRALIVIAYLCAVPVIGYLVQSTPGFGSRGRSPFEGAVFALQAVFLAGVTPFLLALAVTLVAMEYGHGTVRVLLARGAGRTRLLLAKLLALEVLGLGLLIAYGALATVEYAIAMVVWGIGPAMIVAAPWTDLGLAVGTAAIAMTVAIVTGATAGVVGRSVAAGLILGFGFFAIDSALLPLLTHALSAHVSLGIQLLMLVARLRLSALSGQAGTALEAIAVVAIWLAAMLALALRSLDRRDVLE
jgi:ABC-2 type transport system permease protein